MASELKGLRWTWSSPYDNSKRSAESSRCSCLSHSSTSPRLSTLSIVYNRDMKALGININSWRISQPIVPTGEARFKNSCKLVRKSCQWRQHSRLYNQCGERQVLRTHTRHILGCCTGGYVTFIIEPTYSIDVAIQEAALNLSTSRGGSSNLLKSISSVRI